MPTVSILGCGWLGLPLAERLLAKGYAVNGSTTTAEKLTVLTEKKINAFQIALTEQEVTGNLQDFLANAEVLVIAIPPKLRAATSAPFAGKLEILLPYLEQSPVKKVLFIKNKEKRTWTMASTNCLQWYNTLIISRLKEMLRFFDI